MEQNKTRTYLVYAIGEILLVVIGILIALQVNNWNEKRINEQELSILFNNALEFYEASTDWLPGYYEIILREDSLITVLANANDPASFRNDPELFFSVYRNILAQQEFAPYMLSSSVVNLLDERKVDFPSSRQDLLNVLENHQAAVSYTVHSSEGLKERTQNLIDWLVQDAPFYFDEDSLSTEKKILLYQNSNIFNHYLTRLKGAYDQLLMSIAWSTTTSIGLHAQLLMIEEPLDASGMHKLAGSYRYNPMENLGCTEPQKGSGGFWDVAFLQLMYNATDGDIEVHVIDHESQVINTITLAPRERNGIFVVSGHALRVMNQGECDALYIPGPMQYLVIE
ncbi:MAG: DUF6090 family protein [Balneolaceae bacterium]|nr:DUF6090 family protein [Balneolaceae bacterium]